MPSDEEAASPGIKHSVCSPQKGTAVLQVAREDAAAKTAPDATGCTRQPDTGQPEVASPVGVVGLALARAGTALALASGSSGSPRRYPFHNFRREQGLSEAHARDTRCSEAGGEPTANCDSPRRGGQQGGGGTPREGFEAAQQLRAAALSAEKLALLEVCLWVRPVSAAFLDAATRKSVD